MEATTARWDARLERARTARLVAVYTAAAFHNRRVSVRFEGEGKPKDHAAWADAWDRAAAMIAAAPSDEALPAVADRLEREGAAADSPAWRAVCRHAAAEIRQVGRRTA